MIKTNAMRLLAQAGIHFTTKEYQVDENDLSGVHAAAQLGLDSDKVFKTLVARGEKKGLMVFCVPVAYELDLKKAASAAHDKKIELITVRELPELTGYIRGGCSPVGMKKKYPVFIDETAELYDTIYISAGTRGCQMELDPRDLIDYVQAEIFDLIS